MTKQTLHRANLAYYKDGGQFVVFKNRHGDCGPCTKAQLDAFIAQSDGRVLKVFKSEVVQPGDKLVPLTAWK